MAVSISVGPSQKVTTMDTAVIMRIPGEMSKRLVSSLSVYTDHGCGYRTHRCSGLQFRRGLGSISSQSVFDKRLIQLALKVFSRTDFIFFSTFNACLSRVFRPTLYIGSFLIICQPMLQNLIQNRAVPGDPSSYTDPRKPSANPAHT